MVKNRKGRFMKPRTAKSMELYDVMLKRGYPKEFCEQITLNLNTDLSDSADSALSGESVFGIT